MNDFLLPEKLYMPRKSFELLEDINKRKDEIYNYYEIFNKHHSNLSYNNSLMNSYWCMERAMYHVICKSNGLFYKDYLPGRVYTYSLAKKLIMKYTNNKDKILEFGCGSGLCCSLLAKEKINVTGIDLIPAALEYAIDISDEYCVKVNYVLGNIKKMIVEENKFDIIYSLGVFEHYPIDLQDKIFSDLLKISTNYIIVFIPNLESPIYKTMQEVEMCNIPEKYVYPSDKNIIDVDLSHFGSKYNVDLVETSSIHIVPPKMIPSKFLNIKSTYFFEKICNNALINYNKDLISTWTFIENSCNEIEKKQYGWFKYAIYKIND